MSGFIWSLLILVTTLVGESSPARTQTGGGVRADFNGDGFSDLAIGAPGERQGEIQVGAVHVLYGGASGLAAEGSQLWTQDSPGIVDSSEGGELFGNALGVGDFNGDGFDDLAIGAPRENLGSASRGGGVNVLYGSAAGLSAQGDQFWTQDRRGIQGEVASDDAFGSSLASGDFDGDGFQDLAISAPGDHVNGVEGAGAVNVLYGAPAGLTRSRNQLWSQDSPGMPEVAESSDQFGRGLAAADFDGDGFADLAIGNPGEVPGGLVHVLYGAAAGLSADRNQHWHQDSPGVADVAESGDYFGWVLTAGDLNGDDLADLVVGVALEDVGDVGDAGAVAVLYGSSTGVTAAGNQFWHQDRPGVPDVAEPNDELGSTSLAVGDFDADGFGDLAVGVIKEDPGEVVSAGAALVLYGTAAGLAADRSQLWTQDRSDVRETGERIDLFGWSLAGADFDGDGFEDLAIGVPGDRDLSGGVVVLYGRPGGLTSRGSQLWNQDRQGIEGDPVPEDYFGSSLGN